MSQLSAWAYALTSHFKAEGRTLKRSHAHEILAAGLGFKQLASMSRQDHEDLKVATYAVFSIEHMQSRAAGLGYELSTEDLSRLVSILRSEFRQRPHPFDDRMIGNTSLLDFSDEPHPEQDRLVHRNGGGMVDSRQAFVSSPVSSLEEDQAHWRWRVQGVVRVIGDGLNGLEVPVMAIIGYPRLGRRLLGKAVVLSSEQTGIGKSYEWEPHLDGYA